MVWSARKGSLTLIVEPVAVVGCVEAEVRCLCGAEDGTGASTLLKSGTGMHLDDDAINFCEN